MESLANKDLLKDVNSDETYNIGKYDEFIGSNGKV